MAGVFDIEIEPGQGASGGNSLGGSASDPADNNDLDMTSIDMKDVKGPDMQEIRQNLLRDPSLEAFELSDHLSGKTGPGDFELRKVLGKGGYGKVFQVRKLTGDDQVRTNCLAFGPCLLNYVTCAEHSYRLDDLWNQTESISGQDLRHEGP